MLTQNKIKDWLLYDKDTGLFFWKRVHPGIPTGGRAGSVNNVTGYLSIRIGGHNYYCHRLAWLYEFGYFPENGLDHINNSRSDNRITNLREVSHSCNMKNTGMLRNNKTGVKGVRWHSRDSVWRAEIQNNKHTYFLGQSKEFHEAVFLRLAAEQCLGWEDCREKSSACLAARKILARVKLEFPE